jgi:hypothetical protein
MTFIQNKSKGFGKKTKPKIRVFGTIVFAQDNGVESTEGTESQAFSFIQRADGHLETRKKTPSPSPAPENRDPSPADESSPETKPGVLRTKSVAKGRRKTAELVEPSVLMPAETRLGGSTSTVSTVSTVSPVSAQQQTGGGMGSDSDSDSETDKSAYIELEKGAVVYVTVFKSVEKRHYRGVLKKEDKFFFKIKKSGGRVLTSVLLEEVRTVLVKLLRNISPSSVKFWGLQLKIMTPYDSEGVARTAVTKKTAYGLLKGDNEVGQINYSDEPFEISLSSNEAVQTRRDGTISLNFVSSECNRYSSGSPDGDGDTPYKNVSGSCKALEAFIKLLRNKIVLPKTGYVLVLCRETGRLNSADRFVNVSEISPLCWTLITPLLAYSR